MKLRGVLLVCLCVLLFCILADAAKNRNRRTRGRRNKKSSRPKASWSCDKKEKYAHSTTYGQGPGEEAEDWMQGMPTLYCFVVYMLICLSPASWSCDKKEKYVHTTTAKDLEKKLKIGCKKGQVLTSISLVGHNGSCKGLTPDLFVQMNKCYWERDCTFNYNTTAANYMLKLFEGDSSVCVVKQPDTFTFSYECTHKKAPLFELFTTDGEMNATVKGGIIRSHSYHPWLYKRKDKPKALTLFRPIPHKKYKHFVFTIRSLNLVSGDSLKIRTGSKGEETKVTLNDTDAVALNESKTHVITDVKDDVVIVSLHTSSNTNGSEGFVLCFRWMRWKPKYKNKVAIACQKQLLPKKCKPKKG
ncbi:hypothetical protein V1264_006305 [Littorina saxatilis]|uniref:Uncharacterized protein n=1 Tax=Littorina saxatilis TaxID=31220 RepID=A0AAN9G4S3_9CAEN